MFRAHITDGPMMGLVYQCVGHISQMDQWWAWCTNVSGTYHRWTNGGLGVPMFRAHITDGPKFRAHITDGPMVGLVCQCFGHISQMEQWWAWCTNVSGTYHRWTNGGLGVPMFRAHITDGPMVGLVY